VKCIRPVVSIGAPGHATANGLPMADFTAPMRAGVGSSVVPRGRNTMVFARICAASMALLFLAAPAAADGAPAPVLATTDTPTDPAGFEWLSENGRTALADAIAKHRSGEIFAYVFAGGPGGDYWAYRSAASGKALFSLDDLARKALQSCEFFSRAPCFVLSVNGNDARDATGGLPLQPSMLAGQPETFDAARVPFVALSDHALLAAYPSEPKAKVLVVTVNAGWLWRTGANIFEAAATAFADCQKTYPGQACILYAVNSRVVFAPGGPY